MQRSSARRSKNIPFSVCRRQGDSSLPSGCTQQPSEITRQGRGKSAEKEPEKRIKDLPFRSADRQPRERRHTENHMPKRQQWQNTHRLPSIQREVPQMPVLTVPLEDMKSRPLRKFFFQKTKTNIKFKSQIPRVNRNLGFFYSNGFDLIILSIIPPKMKK